MSYIELPLPLQGAGVLKADTDARTDGRQGPVFQGLGVMPRKVKEWRNGGHEEVRDGSTRPESQLHSAAYPSRIYGLDDLVGAEYSETSVGLCAALIVDF